MATIHIDLHILLQRVAAQIATLSEVTDRLQHATADFPASFLAAHCETVQEIDHLHQSLQALSGFLNSLSIALPDTCMVDARPHLDDVLLSRLCSGLLGVEHDPPPAAGVGDVDFFEPAAPSEAPLRARTA